jgi:hypothetical protein
MEFPFYISDVLNPDENGYSVVTSKIAKEYIRKNKCYSKYSPFSLSGETASSSNKLASIIDKMGANSSKA